MHKLLKIYIERLKDEHVEKIDETLEPAFLEIQEKELQFNHPIYLKGSAYLASDHLILELDVHTIAQLPCNICNDPVEIPVQVDHLRYTIPTDTIKGGVFDYAEEVRDAILLKAPAFIECGGGNCPERQVIKKYLKQ